MVAVALFIEGIVVRDGMGSISKRLCFFLYRYELLVIASCKYGGKYNLKNELIVAYSKLYHV